MRELTAADREQLTDRVEILEAIDSAIGQGAHLMELAGTSETSDDLRVAIQDWLGCSPIAARAVCELQIRRVPRAERQKITDELHQLRRELAEHSGN